MLMPSHDLATTPLHWQADALWQQLEPYLPGLSVEVLARAESTNSLLLDRARLGGGRHDAPVTTPGELEAIRRRGQATEGAAGPSTDLPAAAPTTPNPACWWPSTRRSAAAARAAPGTPPQGPR